MRACVCVRMCVRVTGVCCVCVCACAGACACPHRESGEGGGGWGVGGGGNLFPVFLFPALAVCYVQPFWRCNDGDHGGDKDADSGGGGDGDVDSGRQHLDGQDRRCRLPAHAQAR